ncbi:YafY family protein [uncultured Chitinophaga sp.]|uniref:helix-turn-helix transcriptional regulator n=1 Tax=uncultured Chitinophaga sp. TaxID=339340 RepID=UPI0025D584DA|nr:YafY family protein [uncultured Chitinophaga sp.]
MPANDTSRLSRLTAILNQLQAKRMVTATALAEKFGISVRTVYRDIRALEQSGVPILTEEGKGYYLMEGYRIPPISFTETEANALITAQQFVLKNKDASFVKAYTDAIDKIKAVLRHTAREQAEMLSSRTAVSESSAAVHTSNHLAILQQALTGFNLVQLSYQKPGEDKTESRTVEPFAILSTQDNWLLVAWCRLRNDFRNFRLDRIRQVIVSEDKFKPHELTLEAYFKKTWK